MAFLQRLTPEYKQQMRAYADEYIEFLRKHHADRERVCYARECLDRNGFKELKLSENGSLAPGDKFYYLNYAKNIVAGVIGSDMVRNGVVFVGAHGDYPHLDLKPNPVLNMDKHDAVTLKTHYYGGIKKYMYTTVPLMLKGFLSKNGVLKSFTIGDKPEDPVFTIPDLLIHLSGEQLEKKAKEVVTGEDLNVLACCASESKDVKLSDNFYSLLEAKCGVSKEDVPFCEFQLFPAVPARYVGLDSLLIGGPGQDDGICCFSALKALLNAKNPKSTIITAFYAYEETGSRGCTGANSAFVKQTLEDVFYRFGLSQRQFAGIFQRSLLISADVTAAYDVNFAKVHDEKQAAVLNRGIAIARYTGARGKSDSTEAATEVLARFRQAVHDDGLYQFSEMGAVDIGGGGTIAKYVAEQLNAEIIDVGQAVMNMHSYFEVTGVADLWSGIEVFTRLFEHGA